MREKKVALKKLLLVLILLFGAGFLVVMSLAQRYSHLDRETVVKLKRPITPDQEQKLLALTTPLLGAPPKAPKPRVVIVGMDGLDFQYLDPLMKEGKLPNFKRVMEEGSRGILLSIIPPQSAGAWPAMVTGCKPGKTNLLNFRVYNPLSRKIVLTDGRYLERPALWDILGEYGKKSIVINEPMSYPPHKIRGILISGLLAPEGKIYTYPEALSSVLDDIGYKREAVPKGEGFFAPQSTLLSDLLLTERKRMELALLLMEKNDWDLIFCMFSSTDRMMHHLGRHFTLEDLEKNLLEMDRILGVFLDHLPQDATLLLTSDHGFTLYPMQFSVPRWLEQEGYWVLPQEGMPKKTPTFRFLQFLKRLKEKTPLPDIPGIHWPHPLQRDDITPPIDWERTRAISAEVGGNWGSIRILRKGNEKELLENEITGKLAQLVNPKTGEPVVKRIMRGKDLFSGPYQALMPDLVFELKETRADFAFHDQLFRKEPVYHHRLEGVLLGWGNGIRKGTLLPSSDITDITPTALYLLATPVAEELDGKIVDTLFDSSFITAHPPQQIPHYSTKKVEWVGNPDQSGESPEDIKETLRSLGYLQ